MRRRLLVTYDISDEKRLRRVFKIMKGFGLHIQLSVFECELSQREQAMMEAELNKEINHKEDQVLIVDLGPAHQRDAGQIRSLGRPYGPLVRKVIVI